MIIKTVPGPLCNTDLMPHHVNSSSKTDIAMISFRMNSVTNCRLCPIKAPADDLADSGTEEACCDRSALWVIFAMPPPINVYGVGNVLCVSLALGKPLFSKLQKWENISGDF